MDPRRLAARFAAKEATMKAQRRDESALPWRSIGVLEDASGRVWIELTGRAAALARRRGVIRLAVSLAQQGPLAAAIVFAELNEP
jgi:holo-[acyl-carrier protein] synthase